MPVTVAPMCGRFASQLPPELLRRAFAALGDIPNTPPSWNVAPTQAALVVRRHPETGERRLDALRWGLVPHFTKDLKACKRPINARSETIGSSGMFRGALAARRCLVPADAFYEWKAVAGRQAALRDSPDRRRAPRLRGAMGGLARSGRRGVADVHHCHHGRER